MTEIDLSEFSVAELRKLSQRVEKELERRQTKERREVAVRIRELASSVGMSVEEIVGTDKEAKTKSLGQPKYRNPDNPKQTWTGKGKRPAWYKKAIEEGKTPEELEIS